MFDQVVRAALLRSAQRHSRCVRDLRVLIENIQMAGPGSGVWVARGCLSCSKSCILDGSDGGRTIKDGELRLSCQRELFGLIETRLTGGEAVMLAMMVKQVRDVLLISKEHTVTHTRG